MIRPATPDRPAFILDSPPPAKNSRSDRQEPGLFSKLSGVEAMEKALAAHEAEMERPAREPVRKREPVIEDPRSAKREGKRKSTPRLLSDLAAVDPPRAPDHHPGRAADPRGDREGAAFLVPTRPATAPAESTTSAEVHRRGLADLSSAAGRLPQPLRDGPCAVRNVTPPTDSTGSGRPNIARRETSPRSAPEHRRGTTSGLVDRPAADGEMPDATRRAAAVDAAPPVMAGAVVSRPAPSGAMPNPVPFPGPAPSARPVADAASTASNLKAGAIGTEAVRAGRPDATRIDLSELDAGVDAVSPDDLRAAFSACTRLRIEQAGRPSRESRGGTGTPAGPESTSPRGGRWGIRAARPDAPGRMEAGAPERLEIRILSSGLLGWSPLRDVSRIDGNGVRRGEHRPGSREAAEVGPATDGESMSADRPVVAPGREGKASFGSTGEERNPLHAGLAGRPPVQGAPDLPEAVLPGEWTAAVERAVASLHPSGSAGSAASAEAPPLSSGQLLLLDAIRAGLGRMREAHRLEADLTLQTPETGRLRIRIVERGASLQVVVQADQPARWMAQDGLKGQLEKALDGLGYDDVSLHLGSREQADRQSDRPGQREQEPDTDRVKLPEVDEEQK